jgi:hypothetical protein
VSVVRRRQVCIHLLPVRFSAEQGKKA